MALVSDILSRGYRESNLIPMGQTLTANQTTEALALLNTIVLSVLGNEAGQNLNDLIIGGDFDQTEYLIDYIPDDTRLVFNLEEGPLLLGLDPYPVDGQRVSVVDTGRNLSTYTVTLNANGRVIEGLTEVTLDTDGLSRHWLYNADTGNWVKISELISTDTFPFPVEFEDFFTTMLALRLNPRYGQEMSPATMEAFKRSRSQFRARYGKIRYTPEIDLALVLPLRRRYSWTEDQFDRGYFYWPM